MDGDVGLNNTLDISEAIDDGTTDDDDEDIYEVAKIVGISKVDGEELYKVRWVGYSPSWDTWEPIENLSSCLDMIDDYKKEHNDKKKKKNDEGRRKASGKKNNVPESTNVTLKFPGPKYEYIEEDETTLKDTFWEDLKEGKLQFEGDMYSKVKGQGRAARPTSLKEGGTRENESSTESKRKRTNDAVNNKGSSYKKKRAVRKTVDSTSAIAAVETVERDESKQRNVVENDDESSLDSCATIIEASENVSSNEMDGQISKQHLNVDEVVCKPCDDDLMDICDSGECSKIKDDATSKDQHLYESCDRNTPIAASPMEISPVAVPPDVTTRKLLVSDVEHGICSKNGKVTEDIKKKDNDVRVISQSKKSEEKSSKDSTKARKNTGIEGIFSSFLSAPVKSVDSSSNVSSEKSISSSTNRKKTNDCVDKKEPNNKSSTLSLAMAGKKISFSKLKKTDQNKTLEKSPSSSPVSHPKLKSTASESTRSPSILKEQSGKTDKAKPHRRSSLEKSSSTSSSKLCGESSSKTDEKTSKSGEKTSKSGEKISKSGEKLPKPKEKLASSSYDDRSKDKHTISLGNKSSTAAKGFIDLKQQTKSIDVENELFVDHSSCVTPEDFGRQSTDLFDLVDNDDRDYEGLRYELEDVDLDEWDRRESERLSQRPPPIELSNSEFKLAVKSGDLVKVEQALRSGCALNLENVDNTGMTLMMIAAQQGYEDIIETLLANSANINAQQKNGMTALMHACEHGHVCSVSLLLQLGAHLNCVHSTTGETALMKAVKRGYKQIVKCLLDYGANFAANSPIEMNAAKLAKLMKNQEIHDLVVSHVKSLASVFQSHVTHILNNSAKLLDPLFPMQCLAIGESESVYLNFRHNLQPTVPSVGTMLFLAHTKITSQEMRCRLHGDSAVKSVILNGVVQAPLTEEGNFVMTFSPCHDGKNDLQINLLPAQNVKAKIVVGAFRVQLTGMPVTNC